MNIDWQELSAKSHYQTAQAIQEKLNHGDADGAAQGIEELIEALGRSEKRALKSQLIRLMMHIIKWKTQPERRSYSWVASIYNARDEIRDIQEETPSLTDAMIRELWEKAFASAYREAQAEMNRPAAASELSWEEVFEKTYKLSV